MTTLGNLEKNLESIQSSLQSVRDQFSLQHKVSVLAVSKRQPVEKIRLLFGLGLHDFAENYLQEALSKQEQLKDLNIRWHYIGQLQSKKIKDVVGVFQLIHTVCRVRELEKIQSVCETKNCDQDVLIQINIANEDSKQGVTLDELSELVEAFTKTPNVHLKGFMVFPPPIAEEGGSLKWFEKSFEIYKSYQEKLGPTICHLSMGTSGDFLEAYRCGATDLRIGESLMGPRNP